VKAVKTTAALNTPPPINCRQEATTLDIKTLFDPVNILSFVFSYNVKKF